MTEEKEKKSEISMTNIGYLLLIVLAGGLFVGQNPYHESRPDQLHTDWPSYNSFQDVDARLWQDPFDAILQYKHQKKPDALQLVNEEMFVSNNNECEKFLDSNHYTFNRAQPHIFVAVLLPGGRYFEDSEIRRRLRYAILSGFNAALEYQPEDSEHIGYYTWSDQCLLQKTDLAFETGNKFKTLISYEKIAKPNFVDRKNNQQAVILYLNGDDFKGKPYAKINAIFTSINTQCQKEAANCQFNLLGPHNSELLRDLKSEILNDDNLPPIMDGFRVYSPRATVDPEWVLNDPKDQQKAAFVNNFKSIYKRITATDEELAKTLATELKARNLHLDDGKQSLKQHIVLISEKEKLYGSLIGDTFAKQIAACDNFDNDACKQKRKERFHEFSYFRGLDGEKPRKISTGNANNSEDEAAERSPLDQEAHSKAMESADGDSQFDYVRRLVDKLANLENALERKNGQIAAIGILGSDVYDKLLVLEAMHEKFPQVLFFTTGMDARFLQADKNKFVRNLIVTSNFSLELGQDWQKDIPPFRDSSQTAYFLATQLALTDSVTPAPEDSGSYITPAPLIHEIGRTRAILLKPIKEDNNSESQAKTDMKPTTAEPNWDMLKIPIPYSRDIQPDYDGNLPSMRRLGAIAAIIGFAALMIWNYFARRLEANKSETYPNVEEPANFSEKYKAIKWQRNITLFLLLIGITIVAALLSPLFMDSSSSPEEPFFFLEGVSIWPTELIRYIAIIVAINGIIDACYWPRLMRERLTKKIHFENNSILALELNFQIRYPIIDFICKKLSPKHEINNKKTYKYLYHVFGVGFKFLILFFFSYLLINGIGVINVPSRGDLAFNINKLIMLTLLTFAILLFIMVTSRTNSVIRYIEKIIKKDTNINLPTEPGYRFSKILNIPPSELTEWISIRLISELTVDVNRLILYPLTVAALHVLSRMSYFDKWISPPGLLIVLAFYFAYLIYCDFRLKNVAEKAEKSAIKRLRQRQIRSYTSSDSALPVQLEKLLERSEEYAGLAFKPFLERPIFQGLMLVIVAAALDYSDYSTLMLKLFK